MKLVTDQSTLIISLLKRAKRFKVLDNYQLVPVERVVPSDDTGGGFKRQFDRLKASTVDIMDRKTRVRRTFARADFNRAKAQMAGW